MTNHIASTQTCDACGENLGDREFTCAACEEQFCESHRIIYNDEEVCPDCALFWAQDAVKKVRRQLAERTEQRLNRRAA